MLSAPGLVHEELRLEAVAEYEPHSAFDEAPYTPILDLARELFNAPTAFVSLLDRHEQIFAARRGLALCRTDRDISFCAHAVAQDDMLVVLDASLDPRFHDNPLVTGDPAIRFYVGTPLRSPTGHAVGTLCVADVKPHNSFGDVKRSQLRHLAAMVVERLEVRRLLLASEAGQRRFENIAATSPDSIICANKDSVITFWNGAAERLFGYSREKAIGQNLDLIVPSRLRQGHKGGLKRAAGGAPPRLVGKVVELAAQHADGHEFPIELSLSMWQEENGANFGAILRDITDRRIKEEQLFRLAHHDALTELPNRFVLHRRVEQLNGGADPAALLIIDLDGFKTVNDDLGHAAGDAVLRQISRRLIGCVRSTDTVARLGGDEFALLLPGVSDIDNAGDVAQSVIHALSQPIELDGETVSVGASVGIALYVQDGSSSDELLSSADLALYEAKNHGRHCYRHYSPALRQATNRARAYDTELRRAHEHGEFEVFYQPQVRLTDGLLVGAEALLRWRHPRDGLLSPAAFMPGLENRPISADVGQWVLQEACLQAARWRNAGAPEFRMGVNLFGSQFRSGNLVDKVRAATQTVGLPPSALELEITENIMLRHDEGIIAPLRQLRQEGVQVAFDDYGTGYASLSMLKRFPLTRLKIDKSFVQAMCGSHQDAAVIRAVLLLGNAFGFSVIAEGVETTEQADRLRYKGCEEAQGYLFGRPMPASDFAAHFGLSPPGAVALHREPEQTIGHRARLLVEGD